MQTHNVFVYQENQEILQAIKEIAVQSGWLPYICDSVQELRYCLATKSMNVLVLDTMAPDDAFRLLQEVREHYPHVCTIVVTGIPTVEEAVEVMKLGAIDYLSYDSMASNFSELLEKLQNKIDTRNQFIKKPLSIFQESAGLIGNSPPFQQVLRKAQIAALEAENILIIGESGTGKELLARAIHHSSCYTKGPFIPVNCGAIPDQLLESELFGHLKGAYTGADSTQEGFFQAAQGGTLFLDEIGNTSLAMQAKLLRVLEEREVWKLGARRPDVFDGRIITATNNPLHERVREGTFREDLYYRMKVLVLRIPPLRERQEDILPLCHYFAHEYAQERNILPQQFDDAVLGHLLAYDWPGNVREVKNLMTELLIFSRGQEVKLDMLPDTVRSVHRNREDHPLSLDAVQKEHIYTTCIQTHWNIKQAAKLLGVTRQALYRKLHHYHLGSY